MFFGGMPIGKIKAPIIKTVSKYPLSRQPKKFSLGEFLDKFEQELKPKQASLVD